MRQRNAVGGIIVSLSLVAAGCGADPGEVAATTTAPPATTTSQATTTTVAATTTAVPTTTTTTAAEQATTTSTTGEPRDAKGLSYLLVPGTTVRLGGTMAMDMNASFEGLDGVQDAPSGPIATSFAAAVEVLFEIEEGTAPDTFLVTQTLELVELTDFSVTADGETHGLDDVGDLSQYLGDTEEMFGEPLTFVVTSDGRVLGGTAGGEAAGALDVFGGAGTAFGGQQMWGPSLPDGELAVGDTWAFDHTEAMSEDTEITVTAKSTVVAAEEIDGHEVLVIETAVETDGASFSFADVDLSEEELTPEEEAFISFFDIEFTLEPSSTVSTAWYDQKAGIVRRHEGSSALGFGMAFGGLPDTSGPVAMEMDMSVSFDTALLEG